MNEEIEVPFAVAIMPGIDENSKPFYGSVSSASDALGAEWQFIDGQWNLMITKNQDYENTEIHRFPIEIGEFLQNAEEVTIIVENIDDEKPIIESFMNNDSFCMIDVRYKRKLEKYYNLYF